MLCQAFYGLSKSKEAKARQSAQSLPCKADAIDCLGGPSLPLSDLFSDLVQIAFVCSQQLCPQPVKQMLLRLQGWRTNA